METKIEFTRINNDVNGNPRYVCHFLDVVSSEQYDKAKGDRVNFPDHYRYACNRANKIGGKKYHTKSYGGGIVFQSYNLPYLEKSILELC